MAEVWYKSTWCYRFHDYYKIDLEEYDKQGFRRAKRQIRGAILIMTKEKLPTNKIIQEIYERLDYSLSYYKRVEVIEEINKDFGEALLDYYFHYKTSNLKNYNNKKMYDKICNVFDRMSEYILFADVPDDIKQKLQYKKSDIPYSQESNLKTIQSGREISFDAYVQRIMSEEGTITKKYDDQNHAIYTLKDFKERMKECPYIEDYIIYNNYARDVIKKLNKQLQEYKKKGISLTNTDTLVYTNDLGDRLEFTLIELQRLKNAIGYTKNNSKEIDRDIIAILREYFRPIYFTHPLRETENPRKLDLDFMDKEHVAGLIKASCLTGELEKFDRYIDKLDKLAEQAGLTDYEMKIYKTFRKGKGLRLDNNTRYEDNMYTISECARVLGMSQSKVDMLFNSLVDKIVDKYEELFEDYYFTFIARGKYKKCSKCGEIKLANERYYGYHPKTKDNLQSVCKKCDKKRKVKEIGG